MRIATDGSFVIQVSAEQHRTLRDEQVLRILSVAEQQQLTSGEAAVASEVVEAERPADSVVPIPPNEPLESEAAAEQMNALAQAHGDDPSAYIERVLYQPPGPDWKQKTEALQQVAVALYLYWVLRIGG